MYSGTPAARLIVNRCERGSDVSTCCACELLENERSRQRNKQTQRTCRFIGHLVAKCDSTVENPKQARRGDTVSTMLREGVLTPEDWNSGIDFHSNHTSVPNGNKTVIEKLSLRT